MFPSRHASDCGTVGPGVGENVGESVGEGVVGEGVGDSVGEGVGDIVGEGVGDSVGEGVGDAVGDSVGEGVGDTVGDSVGEGVVGEGVEGAGVVGAVVVGAVVVGAVVGEAVLGAAVTGGIGGVGACVTGAAPSTPAARSTSPSAARMGRPREARFPGGAKLFSRLTFRVKKLFELLARQVLLTRRMETTASDRVTRGAGEVSDSGGVVEGPRLVGSAGGMDGLDALYVKVDARKASGPRCRHWSALRWVGV